MPINHTQNYHYKDNARSRYEFKTSKYPIRIGAQYRARHDGHRNMDAVLC